MKCSQSNESVDIQFNLSKWTYNKKSLDSTPLKKTDGRTAYVSDKEEIESQAESDEKDEENEAELDHRLEDVKEHQHVDPEERHVPCTKKTNHIT